MSLSPNQDTGSERTSSDHQNWHFDVRITGTRVSKIALATLVFGGSLYLVWLLRRNNTLLVSLIAEVRRVNTTLAIGNPNGVIEKSQQKVGEKIGAAVGGTVEDGVSYVWPYVPSAAKYAFGWVFGS